MEFLDNNNSHNNKLIFISGFVNNPGKKKAALLIQLETIIKNITGHNVYFTASNEEVQQTVIKAMWGNVTPKGGYNFIHVHPSAWMSAVYYVQIPNGDSPLTFQDPRPARMMDFQRSVLINDEYFEHRCKVGELVLFPAWLPHYVNPNTSDEDRISISFNTHLRAALSY